MQSKAEPQFLVICGSVLYPPFTALDLVTCCLKSFLDCGKYALPSELPVQIAGGSVCPLSECPAGDDPGSFAGSLGVVWGRIPLAATCTSILHLIFQPALPPSSLRTYTSYIAGTGQRASIGQQRVFRGVSHFVGLLILSLPHITVHTWLVVHNFGKRKLARGEEKGVLVNPLLTNC